MEDLNDMLCPFDMSACPVEPSSDFPKTLAEWSALGYECVEFDNDLQSCGGCASVDISHDCTLITNAVDVACVSGACEVQSCETGYNVALNGTACIAK